MIIDKMKILDHLTIQEKYLVDYIINNQEDILKKNINELAKLSYTSSATISRLCKKLGFNGYKEFKYQYAAEYSHLLELKNDFIQELYNLYSSKKMKNFFEFAQGEKRALLEFKLAKGDISPSDLCQKLSVSKQRITSILNSLYEKNI